MVSRASILTGAASVCGALALVFPWLWVFAPLSLGIFFYVLWYETHTKRAALWRGTLFCIVLIAAGTGWIWYTMPFGWLHAGGVPAQIAAIFLAWAILSIGMGFAGTLFAIPLWFLRKKPARFVAPILASLLWMLQSQISMWLFSLLMLGQQSLLGPHFSIIALGYDLAESNYLLQLAHYGGIYALDAVVAFMGAVGAIVMRSFITSDSETKILNPSIINTLILLVVLILPFFSIIHPTVFTNTKKLNVLLISTYIPVGTTYDPEIATSVLLAQAAQLPQAPDIIVFPEGHGVRTIFPNDATRQAILHQLFPNHETLIISSDHVTESNGHEYSEITYYSTTRGILGTYQKIFLMPIGEYSPYIAQDLFQTFGSKGLKVYMHNPTNVLQRGTYPTSISYNGIVLGSLLCSDVYSPILYREIEKQSNASILVGLANPAWFHQSHLLYERTIEISKVQAVQNDAYFLSADNEAPAYAIDPTGRVVAQSAWGVAGLLSVQIPASR